uniref:Myelin expression factor 2 n=1 Tax=Oryzias melastigma TaxID=30732 RepID=A0A3B3DBN8_ORYME
LAMADVTTHEVEIKQEETVESIKSETDETSQETPNENKLGTEKHDAKEKSGSRRGGARFHPYKDKHGGEKKSSHRNRVFISNIPYDMKWQAIKDLMREKVGEVTYVELFKDAEGKSRVSDFKDDEFVKKAVLTMNKHDLNGRPLNIKEDPDGEHARRALQRIGGGQGGRGQDMGPGGMNLPPSIANNPNIPPEVIHALQAGRLGNAVFVANLDFKVGWKKLKEVFGMAGVVKRADVKEDKDGKSRGMGTVTFDQPLEAVQAISMFNGQMLFERQMHVKMDEKSLPLDDFPPIEKAPQLPRGLGGIGMGLGPGGQPINANRLSGGGGMGSMGPGGHSLILFTLTLALGLTGGGGFGGMDNMSNMGGFGGRDMGPSGRMGDMYRQGMGGMDRDFGHNDMPMNRGFSDSFGGMSRFYLHLKHLQKFTHLCVYLFFRNKNDLLLYMLFFENILSGFDLFYFLQLSYDLTWQKLKEKFSHCGQVMFAEIKMENGRSKGCGTVRFDSPESADKACRLMNGTKINGREVDVRIDRNA